MMEKINHNPTAGRERIVSLDILRGFALLGIALVNVFGFNASFFNFGGFYGSLPDPAEANLYHILISLCADKFIFIYSFLFGYGFYLLYEKFREERQWFARFYRRRMMYLALFGVVHVILLWAGDILLPYALGGILLFFFRNIRSGILVVIGLFFYFFIGIWLMLDIIVPLPDALTSACTGCLADARDVYPTSGYFGCLFLRIKEYAAFRSINLFYYLPKVIGVFVFGYLASRHKLHEMTSKNLKSFALIAIGTGIVATVFYFWYETFVFSVVPEDSPFMNAVYMSAYELTNIFMGGFYILLILLLSSIPVTSRFLKFFSWPGRMSLTNYLLQSVIFSVIMYGWGFGKFGSQSPSDFIWYPVIIFVAQVFISYLWLRKFRQGPLERIWRKLSYRR